MAEAKSRSGPPARQPLILILCFFALGIVFDRYVDPHWPWLLATAVFGVTLWLCLYYLRYARTASLAIWFVAISVGALWHHVWWNVYPANDVSTFARDLASPQRLRGVIVREPRWIVAPAPDVFESTPSGIRTRFVLRVDEIQQAGGWSVISGDVPTMVDGQLSGVMAGDRVEALGLLGLQHAAHNPGQFDSREYSRGERRQCSLFVLQPNAIRFLERPTAIGFTRVFSRLRQCFDQIIWRTLSPESAALGSGILLGMREQLDEEEKANYLMTGTIHLLAISGLNVGILAAGVISLGAMGIMGRRTTLWLTIFIVVFYAGLVEFQPPVTRAAVLIAVWCFAKLRGRPGFSFNTLAVAAFIVLAENPSQLFQVGAQLSFLAVATMSATHRFLYKTGNLDPLDELIQRSRPWPQQLLTSTGIAIARAIALSGLIWLLALPLVAYRFHVVAPIALLANPLLMIPIAIAMFSGFILLAFGWWLPPVALLAGSILEASLTAIRWIVDSASQIPGAYWWTVGPSLAFVLAFCLLSLVLFALPQTRMPPRWAVSLSALAIAMGWFLPASVELGRQRERQNLEVIIADVGHGGCALIKLPGGRHMLFDAGSTDPPVFTARTIAAMLWREGVFHLDAIVVSHADLDHYNAVDRLSDFFSIGAVLAPAALMQQVDSPASELVARLQRRHIPVCAVAAGQGLVDAFGVDLMILHPHSGVLFSNDNAGSVVCELTFAGHRVLLTGDVEREGLEAVLAQPASPRLMAVAPHHGSKNSDPTRFMSWCQAAHLVVCDDWKLPEEQDLSPFEQPFSKVYLTGRDGAIRLSLADQETPPEIRAWLHRPW